MPEESALNDPEIEACLRQIAEARARLNGAFQDLRQKHLLNPFQWRGWVERYPIECAIGAVVLGFTLAGPAVSSPSRDGATFLDDLSRVGIETAFRAVLSSLL